MYPATTNSTITRRNTAYFLSLLRKNMKSYLMQTPVRMQTIKPRMEMTQPILVMTSIANGGAV